MVGTDIRFYYKGLIWIIFEEYMQRKLIIQIRLTG